MMQRRRVEPGDRFGKLLVLEDVLTDSVRRVRVRCECGVEKILWPHNISAPNGTESCGCDNRRSLAIAASHAARGRKTAPLRVGEKHGRLTIVAVVEQRGATWVVDTSCECGNTLRALLNNVTRGLTRSCGCLRRETYNALSVLMYKHGGTGTPEYHTWQGMLRRCFVESDPAFRNYGARGITVCERWRSSFEAFRDDMGARPSDDYSIDRINNDGNYEPGNCRWATQAQQMRNTSRTLWLVTPSGDRVPAVDVYTAHGVSRQLYTQRVRLHGWEPYLAATTAPKSYRKAV